MNFKAFMNDNPIGFFIKNLIAAIIILLIIFWIALWAIGHYTHHGETEKVPDLRGMYVEEAEAMLRQSSLYPRIIDSMYLSGKPLGSIIEQTPPPLATVKRNRPVYLIINSRQRRQIPLPDVNEISLRQAQATLKSIGLQIASISYTPSEYNNLVLSVTHKGSDIEPGTRLPEGTAVTLIVGQSETGNREMMLPALKGLALEDAEQQIMAASFTLGETHFDIAPSGNESEYFIYRQHPEAGAYLREGSPIDLWLSRDRKLLERKPAKSNSGEDEQFF